MKKPVKNTTLIQSNGEQQALKTSEERYRSYIELTNQIVWVTNAAGEVIEDIPYFRKFTGLTYEQVKGNGWASALHPDDIENTIEVWNRAVSAKMLYETEYRLRRHDGIYRHLLAKGSPVFDDNGEIKEWVGVCIDITDRKVAEDALRESREKYYYLYENSPVGMYHTKIDGSKVLEINNSACEMLGLAKEEILGKPSSMRWADPNRRNEILKILKEFGVAINFDAEILKKDGSKLSCLLSMKIFREKDYIEGFMIDISERNRDQEVINDNEKRFRELIEALPQLFWTCRVDGPCDYLSKQWVEYTGIPESDQLGYGWLEQLHPEDKEKTVSEWMEKVKTGGSFDIEFRIRRNDGVYHWFKTRAVPMRDSEGNIIRWFGSNTDFDDLKRADENLRNFSKELEQKVKELDKAVTDLKRSNQELEQFAYVASHDLQEPLRMVSSYTQLLERRYKDKLDQDATDFINYAVDGANRMQRLINDLLDFSRVTTKGKPLVKIDLSTILGQAVANLHNKIQETGSMIVNDDLPFAYGDEGQLVRVFQNLLDNAMKFRREESPRINVSSKILEDKVQISISDNGIGIDKIYSERVFTIFQRLHTKADYPGTGIGLAICKRTIERHGGTIWFESEPGKGTTFYFTLNIK